MENRETLSALTRVAVVLAGGSTGRNLLCNYVVYRVRKIAIGYAVADVCSTCHRGNDNHVVSCHDVIQKAIFVAVTRDDWRGSRGDGRLA